MYPIMLTSIMINAIIIVGFRKNAVVFSVPVRIEDEGANFLFFLTIRKAAEPMIVTE